MALAALLQFMSSLASRGVFLAALFCLSLGQLRLRDREGKQLGPLVSLLRKNVSSPEGPKPRLSIHVYGGSITKGGGLQNRTSSRYSSLLSDLLQNDEVDVVVSNFAIGGSGPEHWLHCGIDYADVIVSEFRVNEGRVDVLSEWYELARRSSRHLVIIELWSWLTPPVLEISNTVKAAEKFVHGDRQQPHSTTTILSLEKLQLNYWRTLIPDYFNYTRVTSARGIPQICFDNVWESSEEEQRVIQECRNEHATSMQHGTESFHAYVAMLLHSHLSVNVIPIIALANTSKEESSVHLLDERGERGSICIGKWGPKASIGVFEWKEAVAENSQFSIGCPLSGRVDKLTLNTNSSTAKLSLNCPQPYNHSAFVGYIAHSDEEESGTMRLNNVTIETNLPGDERPHVRIRKYTPSLTLPIEVSVDRLASGAYIEFTGLVCQR